MNTVISGGNFEIILTVLSVDARKECGVYKTEQDKALLTVRQKDTDLDAEALTKLGNACLRAAKILKGK